MTIDDWTVGDRVSVHIPPRPYGDVPGEIGNNAPKGADGSRRAQILFGEITAVKEESDGPREPRVIVKLTHWKSEVEPEDRQVWNGRAVEGWWPADWLTLHTSKEAS